MKGSFRFTPLAEKIISNLNSFAIHKNSFLYSAFNRKVLQLVEAGLAERFISDFDNYYGRATAREGGPVVLVYDHLAAGFQIWLMFLGLSFSCFCFELFLKLYRSNMQLNIARIGQY